MFPGSAGYWFIVCLLLAGLEIEAEGKYGWAEKMPTWFRVTGFLPRIYALMVGGRPLTGYHFFMFFLPLAMVHAPYTGATPFSWAEEFRMFAVYSTICVVWDFLWFVFNPHYGLEKFTKENVWWYRKSYWLFGRLPTDYVIGIAFGTLLAWIGSFCASEPARFQEHLQMLACLGGLTFISILLAPAYIRWRRSMDDGDQRDQAGIRHR